MNHPEYFGQPKPVFLAFDLDAAMRNMHIHQDIM